MFTFFIEGGDIMWLLLILLIVIVVLFIKKLIMLFNKENFSRHQLESGINAIIFWGGISCVIGFFGHYWGVYMAMQEIKKANDISPAIVAEGYAMSLITILTGLFIFLFAAIIWFAMRWRVKKLTAQSENL